MVVVELSSSLECQSVLRECVTKHVQLFGGGAAQGDGRGRIEPLEIDPMERDVRHAVGTSRSTQLKPRDTCRCAGIGVHARAAVHFEPVARVVIWLKYGQAD